MCKLDCKSFLNAFGLKNRQCCQKRWQWKMEGDFWGCSWDTRQISDTGCWFTLGKIGSWKACFKQCLLLPDDVYCQVQLCKWEILPVGSRTDKTIENVASWKWLVSYYSKP